MKFYTSIWIVLTSICSGADEWESDYPLIAGHYEVIGKQCESGKLFTGSINIEEVKPNVFVVTRIIDSKTVTGSGQVEYVTSDKIPVLRVHFIEGGAEMEGTFLWRGDLDNDGRISGYVYPKGYHGKKPGLEALFARKEIAEAGTGQPATKPADKPPVNKPCPPTSKGGPRQPMASP